MNAVVMQPDDDIETARRLCFIVAAMRRAIGGKPIDDQTRDMLATLSAPLADFLTAILETMPVDGRPAPEPLAAVREQFPSRESFYEMAGWADPVPTDGGIILPHSSQHPAPGFLRVFSGTAYAIRCDAPTRENLPPMFVLLRRRDGMTNEWAHITHGPYERVVAELERLTGEPLPDDYSDQKAERELEYRPGRAERGDVPRHHYPVSKFRLKRGRPHA